MLTTVQRDMAIHATAQQQHVASLQHGASFPRPAFPALGHGDAARALIAARVQYVLEDLLTTGAVSSTRLGVNDANFAGPSLRDVLDDLALAPAMVAKLRRSSRARLDASLLLNFVESVAIEEDDLLRFDLPQMHLNALDLMETIAMYHDKKLVALGPKFSDYLDADPSLVAGYITTDWHFGDHQLRQGRAPVEGFNSHCEMQQRQ
ncbi:hypothetical protein AMAG_05030 [Allomyces macrogynus ATCC 38327]|uniref:Uncharacterized protein n=1 Tax=Allomyces macrogynus (strain ATCC 38327) TaxID=578462 RepID=A0A0L0S714_ALLM3|nr:hypothetical protein AMAG_05030 [Allomyces macrogynus ATCC 38327]|eukprot:KNE58220.1 hypothetical protein AMAG_05030 [Allomyces macrogynus ATCC 38327]